MIYLFEFMNTAFPKAGIMFGGVSVTVAEILFIFSIMLCFKDTFKVFLKIKGLFIIYLMFSFTIIMSIISNLEFISLGAVFTSIILIISPLTIIIGYNLNYEKAMRILVIALVITSIYSIMQWFIGIEKTAIYGLNIAYGDSFLDKPMGWGVNGREAIKMPSTYQNGNGVALFYALAISCLLSYKFKQSKVEKIKKISIFLGGIGLILSGSRSTIIPFIVFLPYIFKNILGKLKKKNQILVLAIVVFLIVFLGIYIINFNSEFIAQAIDRYVIDTISDPTGNGRIPQIVNLFNTFLNETFLGIIKNLIVGVYWNINVFTEGLLYILGKYGVVAFITFIILLVKPIYLMFKKNNKLMAIGLLCVFVAFIVDTSFNYPPGLMNYFLIVGLFLKKEDNERLSKMEVLQ